jgi:hypothetical protein
MFGHANNEFAWITSLPPLKQQWTKGESHETVDGASPVLAGFLVLLKG